MSSKWTSKPLPEKAANGVNSLDSQFVVLLLFGKNSFGDKIYSYVKINLPSLPNLKTAILAGKGFNPSDFGEVIAAGKGEPPSEVRAEIAATYQVLDNGAQQSATPVAANTEKKAWDEY